MGDSKEKELKEVVRSYDQYCDNEKENAALKAELADARAEVERLKTRIIPGVRWWLVTETAEPQDGCPLTRAPVVRHSKRTAERDLKNYIAGKIEPVRILRESDETKGEGDGRGMESVFEGKRTRIV